MMTAGDGEEDERAVARFGAAVRAAAACVGTSAPVGRDAGAPRHAPACVVCGGRNAGKSTLARRLLLACHTGESGGRDGEGTGEEAVAYLETDCGQPEFSPPGIIGLYVIRAGDLDDADADGASPSGRCQRHLAPVVAKFVGALSPKVRLARRSAAELARARPPH